MLDEALIGQYPVPSTHRSVRCWPMKALSGERSFSFSSCNGDSPYCMTLSFCVLSFLSFSFPWFFLSSVRDQSPSVHQLRSPGVPTSPGMQSPVSIWAAKLYPEASPRRSVSALLSCFFAHLTMGAHTNGHRQTVGPASPSIAPVTPLSMPRSVIARSASDLYVLNVWILTLIIVSPHWSISGHWEKQQQQLSIVRNAGTQHPTAAVNGAILLFNKRFSDGFTETNTGKQRIRESETDGIMEIRSKSSSDIIGLEDARATLGPFQQVSRVHCRGFSSGETFHIWSSSSHYTILYFSIMAYMVVARRLEHCFYKFIDEQKFLLGRIPFFSKILTFPKD